MTEEDKPRAPAKTGAAFRVFLCAWTALAWIFFFLRSCAFAGA